MSADNVLCRGRGSSCCLLIALAHVQANVFLLALVPAGLLGQLLQLRLRGGAARGQELSSLPGEMCRGTGEESASSPNAGNVGFGAVHDLSARQSWECLLWEALLEHE